MVSSMESKEAKSFLELQIESSSKRQKMKLLCNLAIILTITILLVAVVTVYFSLQNNTPEKAINWPIFASPEQEESPKVVCTQPILPGLSQMSRGVDITVLDLFHSPESSGGFRVSPFTFTCSQKRTRKHPRLSTVYSVPDQVTNTYEVPTASLAIQTNSYTSLNDVKMALGISVGMSSPFGKGSFSGSGTYTQARQKILQEKQSVLEATATFSVMQMDFQPPKHLQLIPQFRELVQSLPKTYESAPEKFHHFLDTFGTHYFASGRFGGQLYQKTAVESNYLYATNEKILNAALKANYLKIAKGSLKLDESFQSLSEEYSLNAKFESRNFGGYSNLSIGENLYDWQLAVIENPWLIRGHLVPIESLIPTESLQKEVEKAVLVKRTRAALEDILETIRLGGFTLSKEQLNKLKNATEYLNNGINGGLSKVIQIEGLIGDLFEKIEEIQNRVLLAEYAGKLDNRWTGEFTEAKFNLTAEKCEIDKTVKWQFETLSRVSSQLDSLLRSSEKPYNRYVQKLIRQVAQLIPAITEIFKRGFCHFDTNCRSCAEKVADYSDNWQEYVRFYRNKVYSVTGSSLDCKYNLAQNCKSSQEGELADLYSTGSKLYDQFQNSLEVALKFRMPWESKRPDKAQLKKWTEQTSQLVAKWRQMASFDLCEPNSPCQTCIKHNVNCWNSNLRYIGHPCKTADEWRDLKYRPVDIESNCTEIELR